MTAPRLRYPGSLAVALGGFVLYWIAFYPGAMSPDSLAQYAIAHSQDFTDWHPPVMSWLWSLAARVYDGPQSLLAIHLALLWGGLYLWRVQLAESGRGWVFLALGFLPWVGNFAGVLWKDVGMAFALLAGLALLAGRPPGPLRLAAALVLFAYAWLVRANAFFALAPLLWYLAYRVRPHWSARRTAALGLALLAAFWAFGQTFDYRFLGAKRAHPETYMMLDDLVHLSGVAGRSLVPRVDLHTLSICAERIIGENALVGRVFCLKEHPAYERAPPTPQELKSAWLKAVASHPLAYARFRLAAFGYLLRGPGHAPYYIWHQGIDPNDLGLASAPNWASRGLRAAVEGTARAVPFLFKPYGWLLIGLGLGLLSLALPRHRETRRLVQALLASALLYLLGYLPVTAMADFRYVYWSVLAIGLAAAATVAAPRAQAD